jgi:1-acyl-sn-glycerol-3-phosphate acyltransferase
MMRRLNTGDNLMLFPEAPAATARACCPFRSALFGVAQLRRNEKPIVVQSVAIAYTRLDGIPLGRYWRPLFAWFGDLDLVPHLWQMVVPRRDRGGGDVLPADRHRPAGRPQEARGVLLQAGVARRPGGQFRPLRAFAPAGVIC